VVSDGGIGDRRLDWRSVDTEIDPTRKYTKAELHEIADALLAKDSLKEFCPDCGAKEISDPDDASPVCVCGREWTRGEARTNSILKEPQILNAGALRGTTQAGGLTLAKAPPNPHCSRGYSIGRTSCIVSVPAKMRTSSGHP